MKTNPETQVVGIGLEPTKGVNHRATDEDLEELTVFKYLQSLQPPLHLRDETRE